MISHDPDNFKFEIVDDAGQKVGYLDYSFPKDSAGKRNINLDYVFVENKLRGQGIGKSLAKEFIEFCRKEKFVWVSLWTSRAIEEFGRFKIYEDLGFKQLAVQEDYYAPGISTRLFALKLQ